MKFRPVWRFAKRAELVTLLALRRGGQPGQSACRFAAEIGEKSGRSAAWLARYLGVVEVVGSNPAGPISENPWFPCESKGFFVSVSIVASSRLSRPGVFAVGFVERSG